MDGISNHRLFKSIIIMSLVSFAQHSSDYLLKNRGGTERSACLHREGARQLFQVKTLTTPPVRIIVGSAFGALNGSFWGVERDKQSPP